LGINVNAGKPLRYITGIQYADRPKKIERIQYLKDIGVDFSNLDKKCLCYCIDENICNFHKMISETRLGSLVAEIFPF